MDVILYIHGKGGSAAEAEHYRQLFPSCDVIGLAYKGFTPWDAGKEIHETITGLKANYDRIILIANSIGAHFSMNADIERYVAHAYFISPIVDMEKLITDMMGWANVTEPDLQGRGIVHTDFGEDLSWEYLCFVREHPVSWNVPTDILYGSKDNLTSIDIMTAFAQAHHASLTILDGGDHWFHTDAQIQFLDHWIRDKSDYQATGIGSQLMVKMLKLLKRKGFERASLAVHKANYEVKMYRNVGFKTVDENAEEFIVVCELYIGICRGEESHE